jgi:hypothetical protein
MVSIATWSAADDAAGAHKKLGFATNCLVANTSFGIEFFALAACKAGTRRVVGAFAVFARCTTGRARAGWSVFRASHATVLYTVVTLQAARGTGGTTLHFQIGSFLKVFLNECVVATVTGVHEGTLLSIKTHFVQKVPFVAWSASDTRWISAVDKVTSVGGGGSISGADSASNHPPVPSKGAGVVIQRVRIAIVGDINIDIISHVHVVIHQIVEKIISIGCLKVWQFNCGGGRGYDCGYSGQGDKELDH